MHCAECDEGGRCIDLQKLLIAFGGLSQHACDQAKEEFTLRACADGGRLRLEEVTELCHQILVPERTVETGAISELQFLAARDAEKLVRARCPQAEYQDVKQTALESAIKLLAPEEQPLAGFDIKEARRDGRPTTIRAYVTRAVARDATDRMRRDLGITRVRTDKGYIYVEDPHDSADTIDDQQDDARSGTRPGPARRTISLSGAIWIGYPVATLDGTPGASDGGSAGPAQRTFQDPGDPFRHVQGVRELVEAEQHAAFEAVVGAIPAGGNEKWFVTARVLKAVVELDPALCDDKNDLIEQRVADAAGHTNSTVWRRNHVLPLIGIAARRSADVSARLHGLCDRLDGLDSLYARFPDGAPRVRTRIWTTRALHIVPREQIRDLLSEIETTEPSEGV